MRLMRMYRLRPELMPRNEGGENGSEIYGDDSGGASTLSIDWLVPAWEDHSASATKSSRPSFPRRSTTNTSRKKVYWNLHTHTHPATRTSHITTSVSDSSNPRSFKSYNTSKPRLSAKPAQTAATNSCTPNSLLHSSKTSTPSALGAETSTVDSGNGKNLLQHAKTQACS